MPIEQINGHKMYQKRRFSTKFMVSIYNHLIKESAKPKTSNAKCYRLQNSTDIH